MAASHMSSRHAYNVTKLINKVCFTFSEIILEAGSEDNNYLARITKKHVKLLFSQCDKLEHYGITGKLLDFYLPLYIIKVNNF